MKNKALIALLALVLGLAGLSAQQNALEFNSETPANDYINLGTNVYNQLFSGAPGFTFEGLINPSALTAGNPPNDRNRIINLQVTNGTVALYVGLTSNGRLEIGARSGASDSYQSVVSANPVVTTGTWYHIAAVVTFVSGSKSIVGYVDGVQVCANNSPSFSNNAYVTNPTNTGQDIIGLHPSPLPTTFDDQYYGLMDELRVWNYPRTQAQIQADMDNELILPQTGLIGYWRLNETSGFTAEDSSPSGIDGALVNFPQEPWVPGDPALPVELSSFTTTISAENFISLIWVTQSETAVAGYYIYRSADDQLGNAEIISPMIPAHNSPTQQIYNYTDSDLYASGTYYYWLQNIDLDGSDAFHGPVSAYYNTQGEYSTPEVPQTTELGALYPNPFNPLVFIPYSLDKAAYVNISVYNNRGQLQHKYDLGVKAAGNYTISWDGTDLNGRPVSSGVYQVVMTSGKEVFTRKAVLLK